MSMTKEMVISARKELGVSQVRFAQLLGTSQKIVSRWENGHARVSPVYQRLIAQQLDRSKHAEMGLEGPQMPQESTER